MTMYYLNGIYLQRIHLSSNEGRQISIAAQDSFFLPQHALLAFFTALTNVSAMSQLLHKRFVGPKDSEPGLGAVDEYVSDFTLATI